MSLQRRTLVGAEKAVLKEQTQTNVQVYIEDVTLKLETRNSMRRESKETCIYIFPLSRVTWFDGRYHHNIKRLPYANLTLSRKNQLNIIINININIYKRVEHPPNKKSDDNPSPTYLGGSLILTNSYATNQSAFLVSHRFRGRILRRFCCRRRDPFFGIDIITRNDIMDRRIISCRGGNHRKIAGGWRMHCVLHRSTIVRRQFFYYYRRYYYFFGIDRTHHRRCH